MGLQFSTPVPTDEDFLFRHSPLANKLSASALPKLEYSFDITKDAWTKGASIKSLGLRVVPVEGTKQQRRCLIQDIDSRDTLAVLQVQRAQCIQICTLGNKKVDPTGANLRNSGGGHGRVVGEYDGQELLEYAAVVEKERQYLHVLSIFGNKEGGPSCQYTMNQCGSKRGPVNIAVSLQDTSNETDPAGMANVCAHLVKGPRSSWKCRVGPGIDPVLIVAFVIASDKLRLVFNDMLAQKSSIKYYNAGYYKDGL